MSFVRHWLSRLALLLFLLCWLTSVQAATVIAQGSSPGSREVESNSSTIVTPVQLSFAPIEVPTSAAAKAGVRTTTHVTVDDQSYPLFYHTILRSGDQF